ncbi:MAG TPA: SDR family NAD(P)-dependent oxidoreductase [Actinopolymorphaceae bacterium]|jgi:3-hydroxybutyrate dehydrogenase
MSETPVALVTGAASGLGQATAERLSAQGWRVAGLDRAAIAPGGPCAYTEVVDVTDEAAVRTGVTAMVAALGRVDALVCCAGIAGSAVGDGPADKLTKAALDAVFAVNLRGTALVVAAAWPALVASRGSIVLVSSILGLTGGGGPFASHGYVMSKGGITAFTKALAASGRDHGVRANAVAPGLVDTPMAARALNRPQVREYVRDRQPLTRGPIPPGAVADVIAFLCSSGAAAVTGQVIAVDAGWGLDPA